MTFLKHNSHIVSYLNRKWFFVSVVTPPVLIIGDVSTVPVSESRNAYFAVTPSSLYDTHINVYLVPRRLDHVNYILIIDSSYYFIWDRFWKCKFASIRQIVEGIFKFRFVKSLCQLIKVIKKRLLKVKGNRRIKQKRNGRRSSDDVALLFSRKYFFTVGRPHLFGPVFTSVQQWKQRRQWTPSDGTCAHDY